MASNESSVNRYRVSVPVEDDIVNEFMKRQHNSSFSVRLLVKMFVQKYGVVDVTCIAFPSGGQDIVVPKRKRSEAEPPILEEPVKDLSEEALKEPSEPSVIESNKPKPKEKKAKPRKTESDSVIDDLMDLPSVDDKSNTEETPIQKSENIDVKPDENGFVNPDDFF